MEWVFEWFNLQYEKLWKVLKMGRQEEGEWAISEKIQIGGGWGYGISTGIKEIACRISRV